MKIDRPHRTNGELVGYHISASCDSMYRGKFIPIKQYNELIKQTEKVNEEKKEYRETLKLSHELKKQLDIENVDEIVEPVKRGRKAK